MKKGKDENKIIKFKTTDACYESIFGDKYVQIEQEVKHNFEAFSNYIRNAKEAANMKQKISAKYCKLSGKDNYELSKWYVLTINTKMVNNNYQNSEEIIKFAKDNGLPVENIDIKSIKCCGKEIPFIVGNDKKVYFQCEDSNEILVNDDQDIVFEIKNYNPEVVMYNGENLKVHHNSVEISNYENDYCSDVAIPKVRFSLSSDKQFSNKHHVHLMLEDDDSLEVSVFDTFFREDVKEVIINNDVRTKYKVENKDSERGILVLKVDDQKLVPEEGLLNISNNSYQIKCQRQAMDSLIYRPSVFHKPLIDLGINSRLDTLEDFSSSQTKVGKYKVLTDDCLKGQAMQRKFVNKAMCTPDFMILEGPPGSGKTTTLLEFIFQEISNGKKIILTASTHVAVDNVLEKIIKNKDHKELLSKINPVRIGSEDNISTEAVKKFTYENIMKDIPPEYENLVLENFNLVCGTTIGILQYKVFKEALLGKRCSYIEPIFDYMIIDEASKTTFTEFLVPAIFAKKWIITGDVHQLTPYVEKSDLIPTLLNCEAFKDKEYVRDALLFLIMKENMEKNRKENNIKDKGFVMSRSSIEYIDNYFDKKTTFMSQKLVAVTNSKLKFLDTVSENDINEGNLNRCLLDATGITLLIEDGLDIKSLPYLNNKVLLIGKGKNLASTSNFKDYAILHARNSEYRKSTLDLYDSYSKKLEDEILWRLIRKHELSFNENEINIMKSASKYDYYINHIKDFLDEKDCQKYTETINILSEIALPSVITLLQKGINKSYISKQGAETRLKNGFSPKEKQERFISLEYQYRMHEDISRFPRMEIYDNKALKDDKRTYAPFVDPFNTNKRFEIRNVSEANVVKNQNEKEANLIMNELEKVDLFGQKIGKQYEIAVLAFYNGQVSLLRKKMKSYFKSSNNYNFKSEGLKVTLNTVDKFQGQEADIVFLSMVQNQRVGFMDSVNRVNVAITRAKEKLIIVADVKFFKGRKNKSELLRKLMEENN